MTCGDIIKHRVQACVEDDKGHGDPPGVVDGIGRRAALDDVHSSEEVQQINHMAGQEAEQCDTQDGVNDSHGSLGSFSLYLGNAPCDQWVTHQDDQGGQKGAKDQAQQAVHHQARVPLNLGKVLKAVDASSFVCIGLQRSHEDEDQYSHSNDAPERHTHNQRAPRAPLPEVGMWMHSGHVTIHTDTSHETDAHVNVGKEKNPSDTAGDVLEHPVVSIEVVVDPKW